MGGLCGPGYQNPSQQIEERSQGICYMIPVLLNVTVTSQCWSRVQYRLLVIPNATFMNTLNHNFLGPIDRLSQPMFMT